MPDIGKRIKEKRIELGITQEDLASKLGYKSKTTIAKIENGTNDIKMCIRDRSDTNIVTWYIYNAHTQ